MRLHVAFAVLAITATSGWAAGLGMVVPAAGVHNVQVVEVDDLAVAFMPAVGEVAVAIPGAGAASDVPLPRVERVDRLPRHMLLPDGALMLSLEPLPGSRTFDGTLTHGVAPDLPSAPVVAAETPASEPTLDRLPPSDAPGADTVKRDVAAEAAPAPAPVEPARVFVPAQPETRGVEPTVVWVGGATILAGMVGAGVALYHRIRPNAALENETRKTIFDAVCATPGLGVHEISKLAGVSYSTATYHLERLMGAGMIVMTPDGNKLCYYKNGGAFTESERRILPLLKNDEAAKLFEAILVAPGTYRAALAEQLGVTATTINWHLRRLRDAGLVDETRAGRSAHLYAKIDAVRPTLLTLASKVESAEPLVAERLRRFAAVAGHTSSTGVAGA